MHKYRDSSTAHSNFFFCIFRFTTPHRHLHNNSKCGGGFNWPHARGTLGYLMLLNLFHSNQASGVTAQCVPLKKMQNKVQQAARGCWSHTQHSGVTKPKFSLLAHNHSVIWQFWSLSWCHSHPCSLKEESMKTNITSLVLNYIVLWNIYCYIGVLGFVWQSASSANYEWNSKKCGGGFSWPHARGTLWLLQLFANSTEGLKTFSVWGMPEFWIMCGKLTKNKEGNPNPKQSWWVVCVCFQFHFVFVIECVNL